MRYHASITAASCLLLSSFAAADEHAWQPVPLQSKVDRVQPWTGIVLWADNDKNDTDVIQLEYSYVPYNDLIVGEKQYEWSKLEQLLDGAASRSHQLIPRFFFVYPGKPAAVPDYVVKLDGYQGTQGKSEGKKTGFVDWTHPGLQKTVLDFYAALAQRYDSDPRLAYLQTGFGLWAEYHIYSGPRKIGKTFPSKEFQRRFVRHLDACFKQTPWMISIDAADGDYSPFEQQPELLEQSFGLFDDSFLCKPHAKENAVNWRFFGRQRWQRSPAGGEFSYYKNKDQREALSAVGPNGTSFEEMGGEFHVSFMIGDDQFKYQPAERIREAGIFCGYRMRVTKFETQDGKSRVTVINEGIAPMYHDAFVAIGKVRARVSLKGQLPGKAREFELPAGASSGDLNIQSDRLVAGQVIQYDADLK